MHWDLYNDSHSSKFHILFSYQNNLNKYYYSKDLKRKPLIVLTLVYCVTFNLCPTFRLCLKRVKPRYICERYVFGCQLCVVGLLPDNHLWGSQSHRTRSPCQSLYRIKPVFVGSSFGMPKHLYPTAKVVTLYWFVPLLGRSCIEINNCWFKEIIASLKQSISTDSRRIYLKTMLFCFSQDIQLHIISIRNKDRFWRVNLALLLHCHGENILFLVFQQFSFFLLCVHHQYMMRLIWTHKYYVSSLTVKGNTVWLGFRGYFWLTWVKGSIAPFCSKSVRYLSLSTSLIFYTWLIFLTHWANLNENLAQNIICEQLSNCPIELSDHLQWKW